MKWGHRNFALIQNEDVLNEDVLNEAEKIKIILKRSRRKEKIKMGIN